MKNNYGREEWISIEPNIIMAKEIFRLYYTYIQESRERRNEKLKAEQEKQEPDSLLDFTSTDVPEPIVADLTTVDANKQDFDALVRKNENLKEHLEAKQEELDEVYTKWGELQSVLKDLKTSLNNEQTANQVYKEKLKEAEKGIDKNVKMLLENIDDYKTTISDLKKENKSLTKKPLAKTNTKKIRLFGIPIFSIEN